MADESPDLETWESSIAGRVVLKLRNTLGTLTATMVGPGKRAHLSPADRRYNQDKYATAAQDPFQNGTLRPVRLVEDDPDTAKLLSNPNLISADEMRALFKKPLPAFEARLATITLPVTIREIRRIAEDVEGATIRQLKAIEARLEAVAPTRFAEVTVAGGDPDDESPPAGRAVSAR